MVSRSESEEKIDLTFEPPRVQEQCGRETEINLRNGDLEGFHTDKQSLQAPIFNIHIHVPVYEEDNLKIFLPRIQPVIHLHFDELTKKLGINEEENLEATQRALQKLLSMTLPKFGNVKFHYQDKSNEGVGKTDNCDRTAPSYSLNYSNDAGAQNNAVSERPKNRISENCEDTNSCECQNSIEGGQNSTENNISESVSNSEESLKQKFNLKEAVVLLEDVCNTDYYKNMVAAGNIRFSDECSESKDENTDEDLLRRLENVGGRVHTLTGSQESRNIFIKREKEPVSPARGRGIGENGVDLSPSKDLLCRLLTEGIENISSPTIENTSGTDGVMESSERTLNSLAEGCRFSDILSRFQMKKDEDIEDAVKCFGETTQSDTPYTQNDNEWYIDPVERISDHSAYGGTRTNFKKRDSVGRNLSNSFSRFRNSGESVTEMNVPCWSLKLEVGHEEVGPPSDDLDPDDLTWTSDRVTSNSRLEVLSSVSPTRSKSVLMPDLPETRENRFIELGRPRFQLNVVEEEMGRRKGGSFKKKATKIESSSSKESPAPPKKMKRSDADESRKASRIEEYIPLQASGPTKFAVAPLNKVTPYKTHDAKNFREEMLFGKRIRRFSNSDHLRTFQLKQEAAKTQSN